MSACHSSILIIGSGPAGYTAAIYSARALLKPVLVAGSQWGGQLTLTTEVENYPGFSEPVQGPWLMEQMAQQAKNVGAQILYDVITRADLSQRPFIFTGDSGTLYTTDALIIATGAQARLIGIPGEKEFLGKGVSVCATCDGFFYRGKDVVVVGGGNTAIEEALYLSHLAKSVTIIHRRDNFRAEKILQQRLFLRKNIKVLWNHTAKEIVGSSSSTGDLVSSILCRNAITGEEKNLSVDGVFIAIGHSPSVSLFEKQLRQNPGGYLWTVPNSSATNIPGVFAAGDVADNLYRQAITAAGSGCIAALEAERFLQKTQFIKPIQKI